MIIISQNVNVGDPALPNDAMNIVLVSDQHWLRLPELIFRTYLSWLILQDALPGPGL